MKSEHDETHEKTGKSAMRKVLISLGAALGLIIVCNAVLFALAGNIETWLAAGKRGWDYFRHLSGQSRRIYGIKRIKRGSAGFEPAAP